MTPPAETFQAMTFKSPEAPRTAVITPAKPDGLDTTTSLTGPATASPTRWMLPSPETFQAMILSDPSAVRRAVITPGPPGQSVIET
jgi:hypothetical protein